MTEFPEQDLKLSDLVEDVLKNTYFSLEGRDQEGGNFVPNEAVCRMLDSLFETRAELIQFLKMSIALHVWMGEQEGYEPVPFYVNKHLLSEKRIELLDQYAEFLRTRYGSKVENTRSHALTVYTEVVSTETDYWGLVAAFTMFRTDFDLSILTPSIFWTLGSALFSRFEGVPKKGSCPLVFLNKAVSYNDTVMEFREAWALERKACEKSRRREDLLVDRFAAAVTDIRLDWAIKAGMILPYKDEFKRSKFRNISGVDMSLLTIQDGDNLYDKDTHLLEWSRVWLESKGSVFDAPRALKKAIVRPDFEDVIVEKHDEDGFKILSDKKLDPTLAVLFEA